MRRHLRHWLNNDTLRARDGIYDGHVASVVEETVRNRFTAARESHPVVTFEDGHRWIPNMKARVALVELFGPDTERWIGRRLHVTLKRDVRVNKATGEERETFVKVVSSPDAYALRIGEVAPLATVDHAPSAFSDYDDSDEAIASARKEQS